MISKPRFISLTLALLAGGMPVVIAEDAKAPVAPATPVQPGANEPASPSAVPGKTAATETIEVNGRISNDYLLKNDSTATRTDTPIYQTPFSIEAVPSQVFRDQGDIRLKDAVRNVSGVAPSKTEQNGIQFETAYIRGFSQLTYIDGLQFYAIPTIDLAGVQRVDVLKGPASSIYGGMEPGGLINVIPKLPEFTAQSSVSAEGGSYDLHRTELDSTGPLGSDFAYRLEGAYQDSNSYRDFLHQKSVFVAPSLTWSPSEQTHITTWMWLQNLDRPQDQGVVFTFKGAPVGPITENLAGPSNPNTQFIRDNIYNVQLEHDFSSDLKVRGRFLVHSFEGIEDAIRWGTVSAANTIAPYFDNSRFKDWQYDAVGDVDYHVAIGPTRHEFLIGTELSRNDYHYDRQTDTALPVINIFAPIYPVGPFPTVSGLSEQHTLTDDLAGYLQDQVDALDNQLHLLVGGRFDHVAQGYTAFATGAHYSQNDIGYSGRAGVMYDVMPWMSPYADVARSFNPNTAGQNLTFAGTPIDPTTGLEYEGGIKFATLDKRFLLTTAIYQITKDNVAIGDPDHPGFSVNGGKLRSRGEEVDLSGQLTPELQIIASYAHTDTMVLVSSTLPVGASFVNIPPESGSVWANYTFRDGAFRDFGFGAGAFAADARPGDNANSFSLAGYVRIDAGVWYTFTMPSGARVNLQTNVQNALNKTYYESSASAGSVQPGAPFTVIGKCSVLF